MAKKNPDGTCAKCGQLHAKCSAHTKRGTACGRWPIPGGTVCRYHGGNAKQVRAAAQERIVEAKAAALMATYGRPVEINAVDALTEEVKYTAGHVAWLREQIAALETAQLTRGIKEVKLDGDEMTATIAAAPNVLLRLYQWEREHLVNVTTGAIRAGVDERRVRMLEAHGELLGRGLLGFMVAFARLLGVERMTAAQQAGAQELVRRLLTGLQSGEVPSFPRAIE